MADIDMQSAAADEQKLVNKRKIAYRYGVSPRTIQEWMGEGKLPFRKIGYIVRFDPGECEQALDRFKK